PYSVNAAEMQVGEPVDDAINDAVPCILGCGRLEPISEVLKRLRVTEVSSAQPKQHDEAQGPEAEHALQIPLISTPPYIPVNDQHASPLFDPLPPHHDSRECEHDQQERRDTVDASASAPGKQVIVQLEELGNHPDAERRRIAEIFSGVWIE